MDTLSERERQIATLIGDGRSNPEIASRLFLSRKTVERHVSNILARTGTRNRTELARFLSTQELSSPAGCPDGGSVCEKRGSSPMKGGIWSTKLAASRPRPEWPAK